MIAREMRGAATIAATAHRDCAALTVLSCMQITDVSSPENSSMLDYTKHHSLEGIDIESLRTLMRVSSPSCCTALVSVCNLRCTLCMLCLPAAQAGSTFLPDRVNEKQYCMSS